MFVLFSKKKYCTYLLHKILGDIFPKSIELNIRGVDEPNA